MWQYAVTDLLITGSMNVLERVKDSYIELVCCFVNIFGFPLLSQGRWKTMSHVLDCWEVNFSWFHDKTSVPHQYGGVPAPCRAFVLFTMSYPYSLRNQQWIHTKTTAKLSCLSGGSAPADTYIADLYIRRHIYHSIILKLLYLCHGNVRSKSTCDMHTGH